VHVNGASAESLPPTPPTASRALGARRVKRIRCCLHVAHEVFRRALRCRSACRRERWHRGRQRLKMSSKPSARVARQAGVLDEALQDRQQHRGRRCLRAGQSSVRRGSRALGTVRSRLDRYARGLSGKRSRPEKTACIVSHYAVLDRDVRRVDPQPSTIRLTDRRRGGLVACACHRRAARRSHSKFVNRWSSRERMCCRTSRFRPIPSESALVWVTGAAPNMSGRARSPPCAERPSTALDPLRALPPVSIRARGCNTRHVDN